MKTKTVLKTSGLIAVILIFQFLPIYSQKRYIDNCIENPPNSFCIEIEPGAYLGYYEFFDFSSHTKQNYSKKHSVALKTNNEYQLSIGNEGNVLPIKIDSKGNFTNPNHSAVTFSNKKITFNTAPIYIDPNQFQGNYFLSVFSPKNLFGKENGCAYKKTADVSSKSNLKENNCPANRTQNDQIQLVRGLRYFVEIGIRGYGSLIYFSLDENGKIAAIGNEDSAEKAKKSTPEDTLKFKAKKILVKSVNYNGTINFGGNKVSIVKNEEKPFYIVPYCPSFLALEDNKEQLLIGTNIRLIPSTMNFIVGNRNSRIKGKGKQNRTVMTYTFNLRL